MMLVFGTGLGMVLLGCANAGLRRSSLRVRVPISAGLIGGMCAVVWAATGTSQPAAAAALILTGIYAAALLAGSDWLVQSAVRAPVMRWCAMGLVGLVAAVGSVTFTESEHLAEVDRDMAELEAMTSPPPNAAPSARAVTDIGREVAIREATAPRSERELLTLENAIFSRPGLRDYVIRREPGSDVSNCHGWVFTGGRYWITGTEVDSILAGNGYKPVTSPRPGDLVVYRSGPHVVHTALVRYVSDGLPVLVEGKWGSSGVYLHPVDKSIYGANFQYHRSSRSGHLLTGLRPADRNSVQGTRFASPAEPDEFTE